MLATPAQLELELITDARRVQRPALHSARFCIAHKGHGADRFEPEYFPYSELDYVLRQVARRPAFQREHWWLSQATLRPGAHRRRIVDVLLLNAAFVDIDLAHPPPDFQHPLPLHVSRERLAELIVEACDQAGKPHPLILDTGGGLCLKWIHEPLPVEARPRWDSLQLHIAAWVESLSGPLPVSPGDRREWRLPVDHKALDAARVLRLAGSWNPRWGKPCRVLYDPGTHAFDDLCAAFLPYTRDEVEAFRLSAAQWRQWDANRAKAAQVVQRVVTKAEALADEAARTMWHRRFLFAQAVLQERGKVPVGSRNRWWWPVALALAWSLGDAAKVQHELAAVYRDHFASVGFTYGEAMQAAGSVMRRMREGTLYQMRTAIFLQQLEVAPGELSRHGHLLGSSTAHNRNRHKWHEGIMGFEPMRNLPFDQWLAETRRRQAEAGRYSARVRALSSEESRASARLMAAQGMSTRQIAQELGIDQSTVVRWLGAVAGG